MTVRVVLEGTEESDRELIDLVQNDRVLFAQAVILAGQLLLVRAAKIKGVQEHYDTIHMRARATRDAKK